MFENYGGEHCEPSSFGSSNNLVEKYKVHRSIQLFERIFLPFFRIKNKIVLRNLRRKTVCVKNNVCSLDNFSSHFPSFFPTLSYCGIIFIGRTLIRFMNDKEGHYGRKTIYFYFVSASWWVFSKNDFIGDEF